MLIGCSPSQYRESADLQVNDLLRDRTKTTLGYTPEVEVKATVAVKPTKRAYEPVPTTPVAPPTTAPIEREEVEVPFAPLGPEQKMLDPGPIEEEPSTKEMLDQRSDRPIAMGPPMPQDYYRRMDLFGVLEYAVHHSRAYQDTMEDLYLAALGVTLERHLFSPRPFVTQSFNYTGGQRDIDYRSALTAATAVGVRQKLPYGGEIVAQNLVQFVQAISDSAADGESASLALSGSVPLLRGAGMINLEGLINSERQLVYQVRAFEEYRRSFVVNIAAQYFRLAQMQVGLINRRLNLLSTQSLTERTQALYENGRLNFLEVQRSIQSQISAESSMINAEQDYQSTLEDFKLLIGMPIDEPMDVAPVELNVAMPVASPDSAVELAMKYRLDLRTAQDRIEDARRGVDNARNGLLPQLDLTAQGRLTNEQDTPASQLNADTSTYSAGVTLDLPIDRVAERNAYRRSLISMERAERNFASLRDRIINDVRNSVRAIRTAQVSVQIQRRGIELAERRLELSNELLRQGKISARDVVESQAALLDAQDGYERARSDLQIRVLEYMRDTGTLRVDPKAGAIGRAMDRAVAVLEGDKAIRTE